MTFVICLLKQSSNGLLKQSSNDNHHINFIQSWHTSNLSLIRMDTLSTLPQMSLLQIIISGLAGLDSVLDIQYYVWTRSPIPSKEIHIFPLTNKCKLKTCCILWLANFIVSSLTMQINFVLQSSNMQFNLQIGLRFSGYIKGFQNAQLFHHHVSDYNLQQQKHSNPSQNNSYSM